MYHIWIQTVFLIIERYRYAILDGYIYFSNQSFCENLWKFYKIATLLGNEKLQTSNPLSLWFERLRFFLWQLNLTRGRKRKAKARSCRGTTFEKEVRKRADAPLTNVKVGRGASSLIVSNLGGLRSPVAKLGCPWFKLSRSPVTKGPTVALSR